MRARPRMGLPGPWKSLQAQPTQVLGTVQQELPGGSGSTPPLITVISATFRSQRHLGSDSVICPLAVAAGAGWNRRGGRG